MKAILELSHFQSFMSLSEKQLEDYEFTLFSRQTNETAHTFDLCDTQLHAWVKQFTRHLTHIKVYTGENTRVGCATVRRRQQQQQHQLKELQSFLQHY
jgi:poly-gamma-glutamate capsule biosynthesis protein CapA/YwtB (metallophosphatase superfamily)